MMWEREGGERWRRRGREVGDEWRAAPREGERGREVERLFYYNKRRWVCLAAKWGPVNETLPQLTISPPSLWKKKKKKTRPYEIFKLFNIGGIKLKDTGIGHLTTFTSGLIFKSWVNKALLPSFSPSLQPPARLPYSGGPVVNHAHIECNMEEMCLTVARLDLGSFTLLSIPRRASLHARRQQFRGSYQFKTRIAHNGRDSRAVGAAVCVWRSGGRWWWGR